MIAPDHARRARGVMAIVEQRETGRARARHARELRAARRAQHRENGNDLARDDAGGILKIVAAFLQRGHQRIGAHAGLDDRMLAKAVGIAGPQSEFGKDLARLDGNTRIDQHGGDCGQVELRPEVFAGAHHHPRGGVEADRHVRACCARRFHEARIVGRNVVRSREQPQRRGGVRRAAADARGDRQIFGQRECADLQALDTCAKIARRAQYEIVVAAAGGVRRRPVDGQRERLARRQGQMIADAREGDEALQLVIAVVATTQNVQRQIDLGRRARLHHIGHDFAAPSICSAMRKASSPPSSRKPATTPARSASLRFCDSFALPSMRAIRTSTPTMPRTMTSR